MQGWLSWLGQSGFLIEAAGMRIVIDPFLSETEGAQPARFQVEHLGKIDWILSTHEHIDHWDQKTITELKRRSPGARIMAPSHLQSVARSAGFADNEFRPASLDGGVVLGDSISVQAVEAVHALHSAHGYGSGDPGQFLGYLIRIGELTLYHSGDTVLSDTLLATVCAAGVNVALLPINGRDYFRDSRDIVGNLTACEAVEFAGRMGAEVLVPMHYDAFAGNLGDVGLAAREAHARWPYMTVAVLGYGQKWPLIQTAPLPHA